MNNNSNNERNTKATWRIVLGSVVGSLLVLLVNTLLWTMGIINTAKECILTALGSLVFVSAFGVVLWRIGKA